MSPRERWRRFLDCPVFEWALFGLRILLIIGGLVIAPVPGPGGVFLIAIGVLQVSGLWSQGIAALQVVVVGWQAPL